MVALPFALLVAYLRICVFAYSIYLNIKVSGVKSLNYQISDSLALLELEVELDLARPPPARARRAK